MGQRLNVFLSGGTGQITLDPEPDADGFYNSVGSVDITLTLDSGFTFVNWTENGVEISTSTTFTFTFSRSDATIVANATGSSTADYTYGLRLWAEYVDDQNRKSRLEIEEKNWGGSDQEVDVKNVSYHIGTNDNFPDEIFLTSRLEWDFQIIKNFPALDFLLTLDPRKFRVKWYRNYTNSSTYDFYWVGYLKTEFLERVEYRTTYDISVVATDGISDFNGYLTPITAIPFDSAMSVIASIINNSFKDGLPISESVRVFETRMNDGDNDSLFNQFTVNPECLIEDDVRFEQEGSLITYNPGKPLLGALEVMLSSWICRVFQWNGVWYIIRVWEYTGSNIYLADYDNTGTKTGNTVLSNDQFFSCIGNPVRRGEAGFTRFNTSLKLGSIARPESRTIIEDDFGVLSWGNPRPGRRASDPAIVGNVLKKWDYINAIVFDGSRGSEYAGVERAFDEGTTNYFPRFWGTANGEADPNLSCISWRSNQYRSAVADADTISINMKFRVKRRGKDDPDFPPPGTHSVPLQVKIGTQYLTWDGDTTFTWSGTPSYIFFPSDNANKWNIVNIKDIVAPESADVELSLCQLVTISGDRHRFCLDWEDVNINLSRNDSLSYKEVKAKAVTDSPHSKVFDHRETYIGDAITNLSSSAIVLKDVADDPVSENWGRDTVLDESEPLLSIVLSDLVNIFGKNNYSLTAKIKESEAGKGIDFRKGLLYSGKEFVLTSASLDDRSGIWEIQAFQLEEE
jgi:hypothetical protein